MENERKVKIVPLNIVARRLHIPANWLRSEVEAGRIPHLKAGKRAILLNPDVVESLLIERASKGGHNEQ
jgi:hypothetical protein